MKRVVQVSRKRDVLVVLDLSYQSAREQLSGIYRFQQMHGNWNIRLIPSNDARFQSAIQQALAENIEGAIIKLGSALDLSPILQSRTLPVALIEKPSRVQIASFKNQAHPFAVIGIDNKKVGAMAADHLLHLGRFSNYLFINDPNNNEWARQRGQAFVQALRREGRTGQILTLAQLKEALPTIEKPLALFVAFDLLATHVMKVCQDANIDIPHDAVVLSVDNDPVLCDNTTPTLSSIRLNHEALGYSAAKSLSALMNGRRVRINEEHAPLDVIVRNSTTHLPPARQLADRAAQLIEANAVKGIRIMEIPRQLGVSNSLLKLRFQQTRGCSMRDALTGVRLREVKRLLLANTYPVQQIAKMCGFSSPAILNHLFRKKFGTSPGKWRKEQREAINLQNADSGCAAHTDRRSAVMCRPDTGR